MKIETEDKTTASWLKEAQKGYIRMGVLILLNKKPSHGYEIMKEINSRTQGFWQPTPGGVYPILGDLEKSGYIKGRWETQKNRRLKIYKITQSGDAILKRAITKQAQIFNSISSLFNEFARDVLNIQTTAIPLPPVPSPFTPFLEEKSTHGMNLENLEFERTHIRKSIRASQERLKLLDRQIIEIKKSAKPDSSLTP